jgi:endonuclease YncB( thermonuclease family)
MMFVAIIPSQTSLSDAHQSGCHRWHSCPSDTGSYVCGDLGYDTYCPKKTVPKYEPPKKTTEQSKPSQKTGSNYYGNNKMTTASGCSGTALCITDKVTKVVDGDTIYTKNYKIRLSLTNTPEKNQNGFSEAKSFTMNLCPVGSEIIVDQDDKQRYDTYGRLLGKVTCSGKNLNAELLENVYASISTQYCKKSEFASESWAKKFGC